MAEERPKRIDRGIAIVVIIAGLLTGGVVTWHLLRPEPEKRYSPEYPVAEGQRMPYEMLAERAEADETPPDGHAAASAGADTGAEAEGGTASVAETGAPSAEEVPTEVPTDSDRDVLRGAEAWNEQAGNTDFVELTEKLYVQISARTVIMANEIARNPEDYLDPQKVMADFLTTQLVKYDVDPEEYYEFTRWVARDEERASDFRERILRVAEEHAKMKIDVSAVSDLSPAAVPPPDEEEPRTVAP
ncbi:MAG: hypothetical protein U9R79_09210 [Armatimonadota bacterium]|nr:hypothetical protein [Armatimonadota bacterium]